MFELGTGEQIFIDLTNSKLKFDFDAKPKMSENEDFWQIDLNSVLSFFVWYPHAKF